MSAWHSRLTDCHDPDVCCTVICCPCVAYATIVARAPDSDSSRCAGNYRDACVSYCCLEMVASYNGGGGRDAFASAMLPMAGQLAEASIIAASRARLRRLYGIAEEDDCCAAIFCKQCALCQELQEIKLRDPVFYVTTDLRDARTAPPAAVPAMQRGPMVL